MKILYLSIALVATAVVANHMRHSTLHEFAFLLDHGVWAWIVVHVCLHEIPVAAGVAAAFLLRRRRGQ